ncbi:putative inorganic phosphate cotransporter [Dendroctonus ponderosae]|nr:putative inorganic phosphate cotransporter [Dendroctonus ponderosae]AEE61867.1 unknown [Dendroctonus ponderosae]KAH1015757.1 hypothetical protein HUJ04_007094 [Dendroctonus ponderosae]KAH1015758.1 hypothetical protein HUJ04_007094 [Dendroctonus ponderosae]KAH1025034.1 hypothetical protein HUJ05_009845 [Dendroctonus ponderosae]KAH1025035.1 hypothetical protein HUJ05_009845 [Dendroctonus ponderosae]
MKDIKTKSKLEPEFSEAEIVNNGPSIGVRHFQAMLMFLLLAIGYAMRVNLSVGIVAMTKASSKNPDIPIYDWQNTNFILSSFFIGYVCLQVFAGELGKRFGVKWLVVVAMVINSVCCILTPITAANLGSYGVMAIRIMQGLFQGFFFPSVHNILGKWAPKEERTTLGNMIFTGVAFGTIVAMPVTGYISASWAGWPWAFYLFGIIGLLWCIIWTIFGANSPQEHKYITKEEQFYIQSSIGDIEQKEPPHTPWKPIFKSMPFWAIVVANSGQNWGYFTLLTEIPTYLSKVANQPISENSLLSAAPYLALFLLGLCFGPTADWIVQKQLLTTRQTRKLMNTIGSFGPALALSVLGFIPNPESNVGIIEGVLIIAVGINAAIWCGFQVNHVDLSPKFSGVLMGIANGSSSIFSILAPNFVQLYVTDLTDASQWRIVFLIAAGVYVASDIFYIKYAEAEIQWWNNVGEDEISNSTIPIADRVEEKNLSVSIVLK